MINNMAGINPSKLRLTNRSFEYEADHSFDLIDGGGYKALKNLFMMRLVLIAGKY